MRKLSVLLLICIISAFCSCSQKSKNSSFYESSIPDFSSIDKNGTSSELSPIELKTSGGAAVTGKICYSEENGFYIKLARKLNITLTYTTEPEIFDNTDKLLLYTKDIDKIDKTGYEDKTVTIKGLIQNYRGSGVLYIYVCSIEDGNTIGESFGDESIAVPKVTELKYDPSAPLPEKIKPVVDDNGVYKFNPYALGIDTLSYLGNDFAYFYVDFIDAFLSYKTSCHCPCKDYADFMSVYIFTDFPYFLCDGVFEQSVVYDAETSTVSWSYKSESRSEHDMLISQFEKEINSYVSRVRSDMSELEKASVLYKNYCSSVYYDYDALRTREEIDPYYGFINKKGICITFAADYMYLLSTVGISCYYVSGDLTSGEAHAWNLITVDGKNYFCDPTFEISDNIDNGTYYYFGNTLENRIADGFISENIVIGMFQNKTINEVSVSVEPIDIK